MFFNTPKQTQSKRGKKTFTQQQKEKKVILKVQTDQFDYVTHKRKNSPRLIRTHQSQ